MDGHRASGGPQCKRVSDAMWCARAHVQIQPRASSARWYASAQKKKRNCTKSSLASALTLSQKKNPKQKKIESKPSSKNEDEIKHLEKEIQRIKKSGAIGKRTEAAVKPLQEKLNKLKKENEDQIDY